MASKCTNTQINNTRGRSTSRSIRSRDSRAKIPDRYRSTFIASKATHATSSATSSDRNGIRKFQEPICKYIKKY